MLNHRINIPEDKFVTEKIRLNKSPKVKTKTQKFKILEKR